MCFAKAFNIKTPHNNNIAAGLGDSFIINSPRFGWWVGFVICLCDLWLGREFTVLSSDEEKEALFPFCFDVSERMGSFTCRREKINAKAVSLDSDKNGRTEEIICVGIRFLCESIFRKLCAIIANGPLFSIVRWTSKKNQHKVCALSSYQWSTYVAETKRKHCSSCSPRTKNVPF